MKVVHRRRRAGVLLVLALTAVLAACSEDLETNAGCPALCAQNVPVRDTVVDPFALDTSIAGYPITGSERVMLLATRGDTVDTRIILRFDSLTTQFIPRAGDSLRPLAELDSAYLRLALDPRGALRRGTLTLQAYDVDAGVDTATATVLSLFRPDRLVGTTTMAGELVVDSIRIPLDTAKVLARIRGGSRLRLGLRVIGSQSAQLRVFASEDLFGAPPELRYRAPGDTATKTLRVQLASSGPAVDEKSRIEMADYVLVVRGSTPPAPNEIVVGGLPARRGYLRFNIPARIVDSTNVIRATLMLRQRPAPTFAGDDTLSVLVDLSTAGPAVTDLSKSLAFFSPLAFFRQSFAALQFASDSVRVVSSANGTVSIDIAGVLQFWRASGTTTALPRALVLRLQGESSLPGEFRFYSSEAAPALRPQLRITFVPGRVVGLP